MKKILLFILVLYSFLLCQDKININFAIDGFNCYFTESNNKCSNSDNSDTFSTYIKYENLYMLYPTFELESLNNYKPGYMIEKCNRIIPSLIDSIDNKKECLSKVGNDWYKKQCYDSSVYYTNDYQKTKDKTCSVIHATYVQYKN